MISTQENGAGTLKFKRGQTCLIISVNMLQDVPPIETIHIRAQKLLIKATVESIESF